jgi:hypothetical protein
MENPVSKLIKYRFSCFYDGILTCYEIEELKEKMLKYKEDKDEYYNKIYDNRNNCMNKIYDNETECKKSEKCKKDLEEHLKNCKHDKYPCSQRFVSYECQFKENNGRCRHFYEIENAQETIGFYDENLQDLYDRFYEAEVKYERELAKKENRLAEYIRKMNEEYDDYAFEEGQRIMMNMNKYK